MASSSAPNPPMPSHERGGGAGRGGQIQEEEEEEEEKEEEEREKARQAELCRNFTYVSTEEHEALKGVLEQEQEGEERGRGGPEDRRPVSGYGIGREDSARHGTTPHLTTWVSSLIPSASTAWQKLSSYKQEWANGLRWHPVFASLRVFWTSLIWCIALGNWLGKKTEGKIGVTETIFASTLSGFLFHLLGGHPLLVFGVSAPSGIFVVAVGTTSDRLGLDFIPWMGWIGIWSSFVLLLLAASKASKLSINMTYFSWEIIQAFIGFTLLWACLEQVIHLFAPEVSLESSLLALWLATAAFCIASFLESVRRWQVLNRKICDAIADYGPVLALLLCSALPLLPNLTKPQILYVSVADTGLHTDQQSKLGTIGKLMSLPSWAILLAFIPGTLLAGMTFIYQNASSILLQEKLGFLVHSNNSNSWDLFISAWIILLCSILGLPYTSGVLPQSLVHIRTLSCKVPSSFDLESQQETLLSNSEMQRVSGIAASLLLSLPLFPGIIWLLRKVPQAVTIALLLQIAYEALKTWKIVNRVYFLLKARFDFEITTLTSFSAVSLFSFIQIICIGAVLAVSQSPAAVLFPLLLIVTLWLRHHVFRKLFKRQSFSSLDWNLIGDDDSEATSSEFSPTLLRPMDNPIPINPTMRFRPSEPPPFILPPPPSNPLDSDSSPLPQLSPSMLATSRRRLKERQKRRQRRRRMEEEFSQIAAMESGSGAIMPPLLQALLRSNPQGGPSYGYKESRVPSMMGGGDISASMARRVTPALSPHFFRQLSQKRGLEGSLEVHSNLLFDPFRRQQQQQQQQQEELRSRPLQRIGFNGLQNLPPPAEASELYELNNPSPPKQSGNDGKNKEVIEKEDTAGRKIILSSPSPGIGRSTIPPLPQSRLTLREEEIVPQQTNPNPNISSGFKRRRRNPAFGLQSHNQLARLKQTKWPSGSSLQQGASSQQQKKQHGESRSN